MQDEHRPAHHGGCLCGSVRFVVRGERGGLVGCHCSQCRRQTGLYYAASDCALADITIKDSGTLSWYRASDTAARGFCSRCGSALFWQGDGLDQVSVMAGAFDDPTGLVMLQHIYCADKADFYTIADDVPRYPAGRAQPPVDAGD
ncbi:hypothetical protein J2858_002272 [Neorhizobium galegae]|uniref:GFA family protein n=1 Tax=Neorhizobium galegae TaxID=399 RepID=UPI001AE762DD|nr:GFA family protein [Neorhizobium galegae]MBP2549349.1 hypothetical protein [Neorhizobium galegae]